MTEITFEFNDTANIAIDDLMKYYGVKTKAEIISKAIAILKIAAYVDSTQGQLIARKGTQETQLTTR